MRVNWDYIAGFFDGEGSISTMNYTWRSGVASTVVTLSQSGEEGRVILEKIMAFLLENGIKSYISTAKRPEKYRQMRNLRICSREGVMRFLMAMRPRVSVKKVGVEDNLRFLMIFPTLKGKENAERNRRTAKYGAVVIDVDVLKSDRSSGMSMRALAQKYGCNEYTIHKYLDPEYRKVYDAYRKRWRAKRIAKLQAAQAVAS